MKHTYIYKSILLANLEPGPYSPIIRKVVLLNILLYISFSMLLLFAINTLFFVKNYFIACVDIIALVVLIYALLDIRVYKCIKRASVIATVNIFVMMLALVYVSQGKDFILVWTLFFPIFVIFINGSKKGLLLVVFFYSIVLSMAYNGIGIWDYGNWSKAAFLRLTSASIVLSFLTYLFEQYLEKAYTELQESRKSEEKYVKSLEISSITDPLTKLFNRRHLDIQFHKKYLKAKENGSYFAFFILDIDNFKEYNDTYGHTMGDKSLRRVAKVLQENMRRESDSTFRLGGEEFCAIIIADEHSKIVTTVENVRKGIESLQIPHEKSRHDVLTASFGVCIIHDFSYESFDTVYKIADANLYLAKESGKNRITGDQEIRTLSKI